MRGNLAKPVHYPVSQNPYLLVFILLYSVSSLLALTYWLISLWPLQNTRSYLVIAAVFAIWLFSSLCAYRGWKKMPCGYLCWSGEHWQWWQGNKHYSLIAVRVVWQWQPFILILCHFKTANEVKQVEDKKKSTPRTRKQRLFSTSLSELNKIYRFFMLKLIFAQGQPQSVWLCLRQHSNPSQWAAMRRALFSTLHDRS